MQWHKKAIPEIIPGRKKTGANAKPLTTPTKNIFKIWLCILGIKIIACCPFGRNFPGKIGDWKKIDSRFQDSNFKNNNQSLDAINYLAYSKKNIPSQVALAWIFSKGKNNIIPLIESYKTEDLFESVTSLNVSLSPKDIKYLEDNYPITKTWY